MKVLIWCIRDLVNGALDVCVLLLLFLPFFKMGEGDALQSVSLIALYTVRPYLRAAYLIFVSVTTATGALTLALQRVESQIWLKLRLPLSLALGTLLTLLFVISLQPYAAVFAFTLLLIKTAVLVKTA